MLEHPKIKYFLRALKIYRPLAVKPTIISVPILMAISKACANLPHGEVLEPLYY